MHPKFIRSIAAASCLFFLFDGRSLAQGVGLCSPDIQLTCASGESLMVYDLDALPAWMRPTHAPITPPNGDGEKDCIQQCIADDTSVMPVLDCSPATEAHGFRCDAWPAAMESADAVTYEWSVAGPYVPPSQPFSGSSIKFRCAELSFGEPPEIVVSVSFVTQSQLVSSTSVLLSCE